MNVPTHRSENILDLVIRKENSNLVSDVIIEAVEPISDHKAISFEVGLHNKERIENKIEFRNIKKLSLKMFADDLNENFGQYL